MSWPPYRRRVNTIEAKKEERRRLEAIGQEWAKAGAVACPGVQWEVRGANQSVAYVVEDGVLHYRDHRSVKYSTPLVGPAKA
jgi:hypothetical protein